MTNRLLSLFLLTGFVTVLSACDKDDDPPPPPQENFPQYLLKTITWDNGLTATSTYTDSTLQEIGYTFRVSEKTVFGWSGKRLTEMYDDRSMYKNVFDYDAAGKVVSMRNVAKVGSMSSSYQLEFQYNTMGNVDSLNYFSINEAGKTLQYASKFHYNSAGDLEKVITQNSNSIITHTIDAWSPAVSFNPCHYIENTLNENYMIYNYAVLRQLQQARKLPAKVTRLVKIGSDPIFIDKIEEQAFSVKDYRIDTVRIQISYPGMPNYNHKLEGIYSYY